MIKISKVDVDTKQLTFEQFLKCKHIGGIAKGIESSEYDARFMLLLPYHSISDYHFKRDGGECQASDKDGQFLKLRSLKEMWDSDFEFFVFNDTKELYRWMGEE
jgi:hypothetical protein